MHFVPSVVNVDNAFGESRDCVYTQFLLSRRNNVSYTLVTSPPFLRECYGDARAEESDFTLSLPLILE